MEQPPSTPHEESPVRDPWRAFAYLVSGVGLYGGLGWLLDRWLGTSFLVAVGVVLGAGLGAYATFAWLGHARPHDQHAHEQ